MKITEILYHNFLTKISWNERNRFIKEGTKLEFQSSRTAPIEIAYDSLAISMHLEKWLGNDISFNFGERKFLISPHCEYYVEKQANYNCF